MKIIKATASCMDAVYDLVVKLEKIPLNRNQFQKIYQRNLISEDILYLSAVEDDRIIGFISCHMQYLLHHASRVAEIQELFVDEAYRNKGVGAELVETAGRMAALSSCSQMEVTCSKSRVQAQKFYQHQGMENTHFKLVKKIT